MTRDMMNSQKRKNLTSRAIRRCNTKPIRKRNKYVDMPSEIPGASESHQHRLQAIPNEYENLKECSIH